MNNINPRPNLFIIGAMKSGTTYLHELLDIHPNIYMCNPKEPCYFINSEDLKTRWPEMWKMGYWKSEERYLELFRKAGDSDIVGESSVEYTNYPLLAGVPERIRKFDKKARFIYVMRDPVERVISHYWQHMRYYGKVMDPLLAIKEIPELIEISNYPMQLKRYFVYFEKDQILTLTFEELIKRPRYSIKDIFKWLKVEDYILPDNIYKAKNVAPEKIRAARGFGVLFRFRNSKYWKAMSDKFPKFITGFGSRMAETYYDKNSVSMKDLKKELREIFSDQVDELQCLLNRDFKIWKTLYDL